VRSTRGSGAGGSIAHRTGSVSPRAHVRDVLVVPKSRPKRCIGSRILHEPEVESVATPTEYRTRRRCARRTRRG